MMKPPPATDGLEDPGRTWENPAHAKFAGSTALQGSVNTAVLEKDDPLRRERFQATGFRLQQYKDT